MKIKDGIVGFVVGDALGVPVEFESRNKLKDSPVTEMIGYGTYHQPKGTFSDDSSMILATMDSIIKRGHIDYEDIMDCFSEWCYNGKYTPFGETFDIGITTRKAIANYTKNPPLECGEKDFRDNGNGSLMRILPISFMDVDKETIKEMSALTHAHDISKTACVYYCYLVRTILENSEKTLKENIQITNSKMKEMYKDDDILNIFDGIVDEIIFDYPEEDIKSTGYVVDTLEAVIYCLLNNDNYKDTVLAAVNLGGDTDTIAAIAGGVAGIYYGYDSIPREWIDSITKIDYVLELCEEFEKVIR